MKYFLSIIVPSIYLCYASLGKEEKSFPFYEEYLKDSDFQGYLKDARAYLDRNPEEPNAPRLAYDLMMVGKAANDIESVKHATNLLFFKYIKSLPSLNFISSFDKGSTRLTELLKAKAQQGNLASKEFAVEYCRAILFIARAQGPELLKDKSLRLRAYLLAEKAEVEEILSTASKSLQELAQQDSNFGKIVNIVLDTSSSVQKIINLSKIKGRDSMFCQEFFLAQLDEKEANSENMTLFKINQALFSNEPSPKEALKLIQSLSKEKKKESHILFLEAICLHFNEQTGDAISALKLLSTNKQISNIWKDNAASFANGLEFLENRKSILTEAIGKAFTALGGDAEAIFTKATIKVNDRENFQVYIGVSKHDKSFEIQIHKDNQTQVAYMTSKEGSSILSSNSDKILSFATSGALPIPRFEITREAETGEFSYNFNLNFGSSFDEFREESAKISSNPYLNTAKGREVLLSYIFKSKPIWLGPAKTVTGGTSYPVSSYSHDDQTVSKSSFNFDLAGNLQSLQIGPFTLTKLQFGDTKVLKSMPVWPKLPLDKKEKFDFSLFMKILGDASQIFQ
jgi:hypothetical protein